MSPVKGFTDMHGEDLHNVPKEPGPKEGHENIGQQLQIITPSLLHSQMGIDGRIAGSSSQVLVLTIRDMKMGKKGNNRGARKKKKGNDSSNGGELVREGEIKRHWDGGDNKICPRFSDEKKRDGLGLPTGGARKTKKQGGEEKRWGWAMGRER